MDDAQHHPIDHEEYTFSTGHDPVEADPARATSPRIESLAKDSPTGKAAGSTPTMGGPGRRRGRHR